MKMGALGTVVTACRGADSALGILLLDPEFDLHPHGIGLRLIGFPLLGMEGHGGEAGVTGAVVLQADPMLPGRDAEGIVPAHEGRLLAIDFQHSVNKTRRAARIGRVTTASLRV
jgi:hypothetical protein